MNWKQKIVIKDLLEMYNEDADDKLEEIERIKPFWIDRFKGAVLASYIKPLEFVKTESQFNKWLDIVYDHCDTHAIWLESI